jgi:hypothetical protein
VSARPGCTLLTVEMLAKVEGSLHDSESMAGTGRDGGDPDWGEEVGLHSPPGVRFVTWTILALVLFYK